jgi:hypothetical protein
MLSIASSALSFAPTAPVAFASRGAVSGAKMETLADLEKLATECNPVIGFWDPMNLVDYDQFSAGQEAQIGFLRQAEIKHGRVAMAAFVGYIVQANGWYFPWSLSGETTFADIAAAGSPPDQWDALPSAAKAQILGFIAFLEIVSESTAILEMSGEKHYMSGGTPGKFPSFKPWMPHPVPFDLFDPFGLSKSATPEKKAKGLVTEINNGRLAMLGIMGFVAESKVPGAVPALAGLIKPYSGEVMAPFSATNADLPFVTDMLKYSLF